MLTKCCPLCNNILDPGWFSNILLTNCLWTLFSLPWRSGIHQSQDLITQAQARHTVRTRSICYLALSMHINLSWLNTAFYLRRASTKESQIIIMGPRLRSSDPSACESLVAIQTQVPEIKFSIPKSLGSWKVSYNSCYIYFFALYLFIFNCSNSEKIKKSLLNLKR